MHKEVRLDYYTRSIRGVIEVELGISVGFRKKRGLKKHITRILGRHGSVRFEFVDPRVVCSLKLIVIL